jgi:uncharacterized membrane protein
MLVEARDLGSGNAARMEILPHRSLSRAGLWLFLAMQSVAAFSFAALAAWRGNVFAPVFALLELSVVAYCFNRVWRKSAVGEVVTLTTNLLVVSRMGVAQPVLQAHPYWVQMLLEHGRWRTSPTRLVVRSHGKSVEVGAFLNDDERSALKLRLSELLAQAKAGHGNT